MPREIRLAAHPQHTLIQREMRGWRTPKCAVCEKDIDWIRYDCISSDPCGFQVHVGCAQNLSVVKSSMDHPSHPHQLTLLWRPGRSASLRCDACGTVQKGNSYICIDCQYWIHESCAALPPTGDFHHHHHPLSLIYHLPLEYIKFDFKCGICFKVLHPRYWVYGCQTCRYVVHINCAITASPASTSNIDVNAIEGVIAFPIDKNKAVEELIMPFVMKNLGGSILGTPPHDNKTVKDKYKFHNHNHELTLISSSSSSSSSLSVHDIGEEEEKGNSDDDLNSGNDLEILLPSLPVHIKLDHNLILQTLPKLALFYCYICRSRTNGLFYKCTTCGFKVDIKCASLPDTIKHAAHPQHHLKLLTEEITREIRYKQLMCDACGDHAYDRVCYECGNCEIILHASCVSLPATVANPVWDKHPLPLAFDASVNHPSGFCCDICEKEMNPKMWMYHCRHCDFSLHPDCFPNASGFYRNFKFGQRYAVADHHHPLAYQLVSAKLRCDVCKEKQGFGSLGFQCHSHACNFFMCFYPCGRRRLDSMQAVD
ncbi:hypothetical protein C2S51_003172 [Perilla frutescens var. frutescens]|nr:hypothetical protein C2S51_003172 [Perilla frutescens var. frutescens]